MVSALASINVVNRHWARLLLTLILAANVTRVYWEIFRSNLITALGVRTIFSGGRAEPSLPEKIVRLLHSPATNVFSKIPDFEHFNSRFFFV